MFFQNNKKYTLFDIHRLFVRVPLVFIIFFSSVLLIITYFILESKMNRKVDLIQQKYILENEFNQKVELNKFVKSIDIDVKKNFTNVEHTIKKTTNNVIGFIQSDFKNGIKNIHTYLKNIEIMHNVNITIFKKKDLSILYGEKSIVYIENIIFNTKINNDSQQKITLQYIYSQGKDNLQYWKNDIDQTIRLSFFDILKIDGEEYYIGSFSTINSIDAITKESIMKSINNTKVHIWFYDLARQDVYNYNNNKRLQKSGVLFKNTVKNKAEDVFKYYFNNENYNKEFKNYTHYYQKSNFLISIFSNEILNHDTKIEIENIKNEYTKLFSQIILYYLIITVILLIATYMFSRFIKRVFSIYNDDLETKTISLEHWKKRFELAIIASNDGMWDINFKTKKIYFSDKWLEMSGYNRDEIVDLNSWFELIHNEDRKIVEPLFDKIFAKEEDTVICEYRLKTKNDGFKWVLARGKAFKDEKGNIDRMLMMSMDIDKNKRMKKELLDIELLVEDGKIVIFKLLNDKNLSVQYISNSIKTHGYTKNEFESKKINLMDLIFKDDIYRIEEAIKFALENDKNDFVFACRILNKDGETRWISSRSILIKNHSGEVSHFYGYLHDITKIKLSEEDLKLKVAKELEKNRAKDRILIQQSKLASMGEMLGAIAHQWRQPLNNISLILHFLRDNYNKEDEKVLDKYHNKANKHLEYMSDTIDDFRNFYKPSKDKNKFSLDRSIESLLDMVPIEFGNEKINISLKSEPIEITNYENELKQAILNILNNAKDAILLKKEKNDFDPYIHIVIEEEDTKIKIKISNNAGNIDTQIIQKIFEPYFTTKFETQGTGIGLYMTKSIIESNMNGKIEVKNIEDGVEFIIILNK